MSIEVKNKEDKTYVVLGAPGSATSFISRMLEENGVDMNNKKQGWMAEVYESSSFVRLNRKMMWALKSSWREPPTKKDMLELEYDKEIKTIIDKRKGKSWGWKDPRTSFLIEKYLPHLDGDVYLICMFRKPDRLVESWRKKVKNKDLTKKLVDNYNKSIISGIKKFVGL